MCANYRWSLEIFWTNAFLTCNTYLAWLSPTGLNYWTAIDCTWRSKWFDWHDQRSRSPCGWSQSKPVSWSCLFYRWWRSYGRIPRPSRNWMPKNRRPFHLKIVEILNFVFEKSTKNFNSPKDFASYRVIIIILFVGCTSVDCAAIIFVSIRLNYGILMQPKDSCFCCERF